MSSDHDTGPPRKRARPGDADNGVGDSDVVGSPRPIPRKDADVWLSDGNIAVAAARTVAFRVHKSILSLRSEVFRDLFSLPGVGAAMTETMDGCPVVHISDSPDDIHRLFLVLFCGKNYYYHGGALIPVPFDILASLIRMGHKYAIQDVLDDALFRLKKYYTDSLDEWKNPDSRARYVTTNEDDALTVIELARLTNTPRLLPSAFLACIKLVTPDSESAFSSLSARDQLLLFDGMSKLIQMSHTRTLHLLASVPCRRCTENEICTLVRDVPLIVMHTHKDLLTPAVCGKDPLQPAAKMFWGTRWHSFCRVCRIALEETDKKVTELVWRTLPEVFRVDIGQDGWEGESAGTGPNLEE